MKREDVKGIVPDITEEQLQQIMDLHSGDIGSHKQSIDTLTAERDAAREQLADANKKLEGYDPRVENQSHPGPAAGGAADRRAESQPCRRQRGSGPQVQQRERKKGVFGRPDRQEADPAGRRHAAGL